MGDKVTFELWDFRANKMKTHDVHTIADAHSFVGMAGYPWIIMAANPQLSNFQIHWYLEHCGIKGVGRSTGWIQRHRWMFRNVEPGNPKGAKANADGKYDRAIRVMREYPKASARQMVYRLKEHGIKRSREWVLQHRCDELTT